MNGACSCNTGWDGADCSHDVDECTDNTHNCTSKPFSTCENTPGSFVCKCDDGYYTENGQCSGKILDLVSLLRYNGFHRYCQSVSTKSQVSGVSVKGSIKDCQKKLQSLGVLYQDQWISYEPSVVNSNSKFFCQDVCISQEPSVLTPSFSFLYQDTFVA